MIFTGILRENIALSKLEIKHLGKKFMINHWEIQCRLVYLEAK